MITPDVRKTSGQAEFSSGYGPDLTPEDEPSPAQTLAELYRRCAPGGGCQHTLDSLIRVLSGLGRNGAVVATDIGYSAQLPPSAVYGCVLELEDYGLARWIPEPVLRADHLTAEITEAGLRFLREIERRDRVH